MRNNINYSDDPYSIHSTIRSNTLIPVTRAGNVRYGRDYGEMLCLHSM